MKQTTFAIRLCLILGFTVDSAHAANRAWDNDGFTVLGILGDGGSGTWNTTSTNWDPTLITGSKWINANNDTAVFGSGVGTVSLAAVPISAGGLTFVTTGYVIQNNTLTLAGSATINTNSVSATISSILAGSAGMTKTGSGTLILSGANSYTGTTLISAGTVQIGNGAGTGDLNAASTVTNNAALTFNRNNALAFANVISGSGSLSQNGSGGTTTLSGANTYTGATAINAGTFKAGVASIANTSGAFGVGSAVTLANASGTTLDLNGFATEIGSLAGGGTTGGNVSLGASTLTTGRDNTSTSYAGVISGTGGLTKIGSGSQTLTGTNTYNGATQVTGGTLVVNGSAANSAFTVNSGGTIAGSGTIGALSVTNGTIRPGTSPGILNIVGSLSLQTLSTLVVEINGSTLGTQYDQLNVGGDVNLGGGVLSLSLGGGYTPTQGTLFFIIDNDGANPVASTFSGLANGTTFNASGQNFQISYFGNSATNSFTGGNDVVLKAVPEPASLLFGSLGVLALLRRRRAVSTRR